MLKIINTMALVVTLMAGLSSCEMKDEILGKDLMSGDTGLLSLNVETGKASRGTTDQVDQFPVVITGIDVDYTKKFDSYADLRTEGEVTLPVGTYTVEACSPGEFLSTMYEPFYGGKLENVKVEKGQTSEISVVCTMQNVKISIDLTEEFLATYDDWEFNVTDKKGHIETYTKSEDGNTPAPVYWKMDERVETIYINGTAQTVGGETVTISGTANKSSLPEYEEGDDTSFIGGDELKIEFNPVKVEGSTPGIESDGVEITITLFNQEKNENVEIPVNPGTEGGNTEEPGTGEDGGDEGGETVAEPTISFPQSTYTLPDDATKKADATISAEAGLKSVKVKITGGNDNFATAVAGMFGGTEPFELIGNTQLSGIFSSMKISLPNANDTAYVFPVGNFFSLLADDSFGPTTTVDGHIFEITVTDQNGKTVSGKLNVIVTEVSDVTE
ncbi:DUF4493 domain-containing protein [Bacteroides caecigallinarum]|uniref:DUF4493 domain-containing protein n=1 Tax=Bacteroides caecigallinarum TaxID=1411144 RepID=UPI00195CE00E|nr:DUF4493 domain-containing protein [Bacteroides caecigallinarum]MBM6888744.1 DUF4493 domain-containing protein [Bacteroides caecigallinarum]